jgi:Tfp pilus assembly protein PilX
MNRSRHGSALLLVIFILATFLFLGAINAKIVYNYYASANAVLQREQAFHLAEAGLEKGKVELVHNPNWFTDLPYYLQDNVAWLTAYAVGQEADLGEGSFKVVREKGKNRLYSIGSKGKGLVILKLKFSNPPFTRLEWKEL